MEREDVIAAYRDFLGREPESEEVIQNAIQSGMSRDDFRQRVANSPENRRISQLGELGAPGGPPLDAREDRPAAADLYYNLIMGTEFDLPEYRTAGFSPDQLQAFQRARELQGVYQPFLDQAEESTMQGIGALGDALSGTRDLAGQVPGQVETGQQALSQAAQDLQDFAASGAASAEEAALAVQEAAQSSDPATRLAAEELMASSERLGGIASTADQRLMEAGRGAQDVASESTTAARALMDPLTQQLSQSTGGARAQAAAGQAGADIAADRARMSTAEAQRALEAASAFGLGSAQQGIAGLSGSSEMYSPDMIAPFMSTYEDAAVQQALSDIARQGELQEEGLAAQAIQSGAYGGSRQAVAEQELARNIMEQQGRTAAQMRAQGFESAAARSQDAFERARARQQQEAQLTGQLGQMGAGAAAGAAESGGRLGLSAEQLAQTGALQGAQLGLSAEELASANAQAQAQTGLGIEQLAAQTGLSAQELAGQFAGQSAQIGMSAEQQRQAAAAQQAQLAQQQAQMEMQGAESAGQLGMAGAQMGMQGAEAAGNLGLQGANLGLSGIQAGLGAQQQAAGIGQGIAGLGQQQLGLGQAAQQMGMQDVSTGLQLGGQQQALRQAQLDTQRMNEYQQATLPLQQAGALSDLLTGVPSGSTTSMTQPGASPGSQLLGLGIAGLSQFGQGGAFAPGGAFGG